MIRTMLPIGPRLKISREIVDHTLGSVPLRLRAPVAVPLAGKYEYVERLSGGGESVDQPGRIQKVDIFVHERMKDEKLTAQVRCKGGEVGCGVTGGVARRRAHVPFGVAGIVETKVDDGRTRDADAKQPRCAE